MAQVFSRMLGFFFGLLLVAQFGLAERPNILFILTDDQDWHMESVTHMPYLKVSLISVVSLKSIDIR